ncbi:MAG: hypothetical protein WC130_04975 [Kiritimatiellia bacterium]
MIRLGDAAARATVSTRDLARSLTSTMFATVKATLAANHDWNAAPVVLAVFHDGEIRATAYAGVHAFPAAERAYMRAVRTLKSPMEFRIYERGELVLFDQAEPRPPELH